MNTFPVDTLWIGEEQIRGKTKLCKYFNEIESINQY